MRSVFFTGCLALLTLHAEGQSSKRDDARATVLLSDISLGKALTVLSISYGVQFSYSDDVIPTDTLIDLSVQDEQLDPVLERVLGPFDIGYKKVSAGRIVLKKNPPMLTQTIRGRVVDQVTGAGISGAGVVVVGIQPMIGTITNDEGIFRLDGVSVGRASLKITSVGYATRSINEILLTAGKELVMEISLDESIVPIGEVVITGLKDNGISGDGLAMTSSRSFSVEDTRRYAGSFGDPARMASGFAGVTGASDENNSLIVRGNSPRSVLWRVEGIEVPNPNHFASEGSSHGMISVLSPNIIDRSNFLIGAFPTQYGNALSAVLDMKLRNGNNEKREYAVQAGLLGMEASAEGPFSQKHEGSWLVNYRYSTLSVLDKLGFEMTDVGQFKDYQDVAFKLNFPTRAGLFSLFGIGGKSEANKTDTAVFDNRTSDVGILGLTYAKALTEATALNGALSFSGTDISTYNDVRNLDAGVLALEEQYSKYYIRLMLSARTKLTPRSSAEAGIIASRLQYNFFLRSVDSANPAYQVILNFGDRGSTYIGQGYFVMRQHLAPTLELNYGTHFMYFDLTRDRSLEPRAGLRWEVTPRSSIGLAYGKHSRIENLQYYLGRDHMSGGNELQVNRDLGFTRAHHIVLSFNRAISLSHHLKVESYYQRLYNSPVQTGQESMYASLNEDTGFVTDSLVNKGNGYNYGIEMSLIRPFSGNLYYEVNASLYQSSFSFSERSWRSSAYNGNFTLHVLGGKEFKTSPRGWFQINLKTTYAGGRRYVPIDLQRSVAENTQVFNWDRAFQERLDNYFRADLQFGYRLSTPGATMEWRLDLQNITDNRNAAYHYFDVKTKSIRLKRQIGFLPLFSYRIEF